MPSFRRYDEQRHLINLGERTTGAQSMMQKRFVWLSAILILMSASLARAQQPAKIWKIGVLVSGTEALNKSRDEGLRQGLRDLGYEDGKNIAFVYRFGEGKTERLAPLARELAEQKPDVIVVGGTAVAVAAKKATSTIP